MAVLVLRYRDEEARRQERAVAEGFEDLALRTGQAGPDVRELLEQALERGDVEPRAGSGERNAANGSASGSIDSRASNAQVAGQGPSALPRAD